MRAHAQPSPRCADTWRQPPPALPVCDRKWMGGRRSHVAAATLGPQSSVSVAESPRPSICSPPQRGICPPGESVEGTHRGGKEAHPPLTGRLTHTHNTQHNAADLSVYWSTATSGQPARSEDENESAVLLEHVTCNTSCQSQQLHPGKTLLF